MPRVPRVPQGMSFLYSNIVACTPKPVPGFTRAAGDQLLLCTTVRVLWPYSVALYMCLTSGVWVWHFPVEIETLLSRRSQGCQALERSIDAGVRACISFDF